MLDAVKRYATRILLIHVALLLLVMFFVGAGARQVQVSARSSAQSQTQERLELLAVQTARGLQSHYSSILADLDVILRDDSTAATQPALRPAATRPSFADAGAMTQPGRRGNRGLQLTQSGAGGRGGRGGGGRGLFMPRIDQGPVTVNAQTLNTLWRQLQSRGVSQLFLVDLRPRPEGAPVMPRVNVSFPEGKQAQANVLANAHLAWLQSISGPTMSAFSATEEKDAQGEVQGYHLLAIPALNVVEGPGGRGGRIGNPPPGGGGRGIAAAGE